MDSPADWQLAQVHGQASKTNRPLQDSKRVCWCCFSKVQRQEVNLCANTKQLDFLGFGIPIYYSFIRCCILLLLINIFTYSVIGISRNYEFNHLSCSKQSQQKNEVLEHLTLRHFNSQEAKEGHGEGGQEQGEDQRCVNWSVKMASTQVTVDNIEILLRICSFALHLIFVFYISNKQTRIYNYYDEITCSLSDYSVVIKKIPEGPGMKKRVKKFIEQEYSISNTIKDIIVIPQTQSIERIQDQKLKAEKLLKKKRKRKQTTQQQIQDLQVSIRESDRRIQLEADKMKEQYKQDTILSEMVIVIFDYEKSKQEFLEAVQSERIKDEDWRKVIIHQAAEPEQIIWENMGITSAKKNARAFLSWLMSFLTILIFTIIFAIIIKYKTQKVQDLIKQQGEHAYQIIFLVYGSLILVILFNKFIMATLFHKFTDFERKRDTSAFQFSFCVKYCLGLFFTTALMTLIVEDVMFNNYFHEQFGVVQIQSIMYVLNCLFLPIFWLINPFYISKNIKRYFSKKRQNITQEEANFAMENPLFSVGKRYAEIMQIMWFTFLYQTIIPVGGFFSCLGLGLYYWVDKYNLLRKSSLNNQISGKLSELTLHLLKMSLFWRMVGQVWFDHRIRSGPPIATWIMLAISVILLFIPTSKLIDLFMQQKYKPQSKSYDQVKKSFKKHYYTSHILYSRTMKDRENLATYLNVQLVSYLLKSQIIAINDNNTMSTEKRK